MINWKQDPSHKPLIVKGARQIGKTESIVNPVIWFIAGETIIIFDEIQEYPDVATTLKAFRQIHSNSEGNKTDYEMFSMDFEEFLWAKGYDEGQIDSILKHMIDLKPFSETELSIYKALFLDYCVLGGMPELLRNVIA